jgi:hypothetical protein
MAVVIKPLEKQCPRVRTLPYVIGNLHPASEKDWRKNDDKKQFSNSDHEDP